MSCHSLLIGADVAGVAVLVDDALGLAPGDRVGVGDETGFTPGKNVSFTFYLNHRWINSQTCVYHHL